MKHRPSQYLIYFQLLCQLPPEYQSIAARIKAEDGLEQAIAFAQSKVYPTVMGAVRDVELTQLMAKE